MVTSGQQMAAQPELPLPGGRETVLAFEQERVDHMYSRLDDLRDLTQRQLTEVRAAGAEPAEARPRDPAGAA